MQQDMIYKTFSLFDQKISVSFSITAGSEIGGIVTNVRNIGIHEYIRWKWLVQILFKNFEFVHVVF